MKLGRIGGSTDRTDWSGIYTPTDNLEKRKKVDYLNHYAWRANYAYDSPFFHLSQPSLQYGDGDSKIYVLDASSGLNAEVRQYNLTTPGEPSTATYSGNSLALADSSGTFGYPHITLSSDGTRMYICFYYSTNSYQPPEQYNLSTPWDITTAVPKVNKLYVSAQEATPYGVYVKADGTKLYIVGDSGDEINEYNLSTAYDVSTASHVQFFSVASEELTPRGVEFKPDGTKMYVTGPTGDDINEYNLSVAWDISSASYNQSFSVQPEESQPYTVRFKPDGTKMFVTGAQGDDVNEYSLSTAWDVSTASYVQTFATGAATSETAQMGLTFSDDGTKMYTSGQVKDRITEWDLGTAWDISTAVFNQDSGDLYHNFGGIHLVNDNKLYIVGTTTDQVVGYTLDTNNDIRSIDGILQGDDELGNGQYDYLGACAISTDGTKFYIVDTATADRITEFNLPTPYELTGATRTGSYIDIEPTTDEAIPYALHFSYDGTKIYIAGGDNTRAVYLWNLSTPWDLSTATVNKQRLNLYTVPSLTSQSYETMTNPENYGAGSMADVEGLTITKDGTSILISHSNSYSEYKLLC